jgi:energy-coupling factor transporter transmembrane protein EcfT
MSEQVNMDDEFETSFPIVDILIIITIIFILFIPSLLKLNKYLFVIGFIIAVLVMNLFLTFFKVLYYDNSWYSQKYQYNNSDIYKETFNDIVNDTKSNFYYLMQASYQSLTFDNIKDNSIYIFGTLYDSIKFIVRPIGKGIKYVFYGESKANYKPKRIKYK